MAVLGRRLPRRAATHDRRSGPAISEGDAFGRVYKDRNDRYDIRTTAPAHKVAGRLKNSIPLFIGSAPGAASRSRDQAIDAVATRT